MHPGNELFGTNQRHSAKLKIELFLKVPMKPKLQKYSVSKDTMSTGARLLTGGEQGISSY